MKKLLFILFLIPTLAFGQRMKAIDIMVNYDNKDYLVSYVIDTTQLTSKGWIATINVYQAGTPIFLGQRGIYDRNRRSTRPTKYEIEFIETALTLCKKKPTNEY